MKKYNKPCILEEIIEIEDVILTSPGISTGDSVDVEGGDVTSGDIGDIFG